MKITIEQTDEIMLIEDSEHGGMIRARLWQGETDSGIPVHCFVTLISPTVPESRPRHRDQGRAVRGGAPARPSEAAGDRADPAADDPLMGDQQRETR